MQSLSLLMSECFLSKHGQGHVSNFYIVDLENFATASYRYTGDIHNSTVVGLFMTHCLQLNFQLHTIGLVGRLKMREWKMRYGQNSKGGKCRSGKCRSKPYGVPTRDYMEKACSYVVRLVLILLTEESVLVIAIKIVAAFVVAYWWIVSYDIRECN